MSTENVRRFVERVAQDAQLASELKAIPAGPSAELAFMKLAEREGFGFSVEELRAEAASASSKSTGGTELETGDEREADDGLWVLDYFYGPEGKWTK